jgi:hypothetical protein
MNKDGLMKVAYEDTDHFKVTRDFLAKPERMLRVLIAGLMSLSRLKAATGEKRLWVNISQSSCCRLAC